MQKMKITVNLFAHRRVNEIKDERHSVHGKKKEKEPGGTYKR